MLKQDTARPGLSHRLFVLFTVAAIGSSLSACRDSKVKFEAINACGRCAIKTHVPVLIKSDYATGEVRQLCQEAMDTAKAKLDAVAGVPAASRNFDNTALAFETATAELSDATLPLTFMGYVSPIEAVNAEGSECEERIGAFYVAMMTRKDIYDALKDQQGRNDDEKRLLSETLKGFEANGLKLPEDQLAKLRDLKTQLSSLESQYSTNLNGDNTTILLNPEELEGVPADYVSRLKKTEDGTQYIVTTRESDTVMQTEATRPETRKKWLTGYYNRQAGPNTALLEQAIDLRQQIAKIMGYSTWADYRIHGRMAIDGTTVWDFLNGLRGKLAERDRQDVARLLKFKQTIDPSATAVDAWDIGYLANQIKKQDYNLDMEKIREYFPADVVVAGMFDVYSKLLGVHYTEVQGAKVWHDTVKLYRIEDNKDNRLIGFFYTDFVPRAGKYGHAAAFNLISGRVLADGSYSYPVSSIVANLTAPSQGKPSLLSHDDVETIFHEFGHIMHQTLTRAPYASLSGSAVAQDFVEAPSQMLENWVWDTDILNKLSGYYLDHSQKLPADLLQKMVDAKDFNQGYYYTRQLMLGTLDMTFHTTDGHVDTASVYDQLYRDMIGVEPVPGGHFSASFGHLMGGYDAGYYGYLWSEVYAADMFTRFSQSGLLSPEVGGDYRREILEKGSMQDALDLLRQFLGREPNNEAFLKKLHIN